MIQKPIDKFVVANGLTLAYQEFGEKQSPSVLLIPGVGTQLIAWPLCFCRELATQGFRVIRMDNRDTGLSQKLDDAPTPNLAIYLWKKRMMLPQRTPYKLEDMSDDAIGLMDALDIDKAHVIGASMGGMIAQLLAIRHPNRTLSLTSIMSTSGSPFIGGPTMRIMMHLLAPRPSSKEGKLKRAVRTLELANADSEFADDQQTLKSRVHESFERAHYPQGILRQMIAITASGSRVRGLRNIKAPSLVIHGARDPIIPPSAAHSTARNIKGASLAIVDQMGHDLPSKLSPTLLGLIEPHLVNAS